MGSSDLVITSRRFTSLASLAYFTPSLEAFLLRIYSIHPSIISISISISTLNPSPNPNLMPMQGQHLAFGRASFPPQNCSPTCSATHYTTTTPPTHQSTTCSPTIASKSLRRYLPRMTAGRTPLCWFSELHVNWSNWSAWRRERGRHYFEYF